ncbi:ABC transporter permease [Nocardioides hungaricus]
MIAYTVRRLLMGLLLILALTFVTYVLFFAVPSDPAKQACGKNCNEEQIAQTRIALGYDKPWITQWTDFLGGVVQGRQYPADEQLREKNPNLVTDCKAPCLGFSFVNQQTVNKIIGNALPITASIALVAVVMWVLGGVLFGILAAMTKGSFLDRGLVGLTLVAYAFPSFFIGKFLIIYVAIRWKLVDYPAYQTIADGGFFGWLSALLLPALTLALLYLAGYVRITRSYVLESLSEDYIRTAKAKGVKGRVLITKHALRAALTPLVTMIGLDFAALMAGALITENVFAYNGLGVIALQAYSADDLPTLVGLVILTGTFVIVANVVVDILYAVIDPRVRLG